MPRERFGDLYVRLLPFELVVARLRTGYPPFCGWYRPTDTSCYCAPVHNATETPPFQNYSTPAQLIAKHNHSAPADLYTDQKPDIALAAFATAIGYESLSYIVVPVSPWSRLQR